MGKIKSELSWKDIIVLSILVLFILMQVNLVSGAYLPNLNNNQVNTGGNIGTVKQNQCVQLIGLCDNCTYMNVTSVSYPINKTFVLFGQFAMTKNGGTFNYSFCNTNQTGEYVYTICGDLNGNNACDDASFTSTPNGNILQTSGSIVYISLFIILISLFVAIIFGINLLPDSNAKAMTGEILSISYLKYLRPVLWFVEWMLLITILYISSNLSFAFLGEQLFAQTLFVLFRICFWMTLIVIPIWIIYFYNMIGTDKELQRMMERGFYPEERSNF